MLTPLVLFIGSGVAIVLMIAGKYIQMNRGGERARTGMVSKVDQVIDSRTAKVHSALVSLDSNSVRRVFKRALRTALVVILHTLHELRDLTQMFLDKVRRSDIKEGRGEPSSYLKNVSDRNRQV